MSAWIFESAPYEDGIIATIWADTDEDLPGVNDFTEGTLKKMSICKIIANGRKYQLDSTGTWQLQPITDLSQYGTKEWFNEALFDTTFPHAYQEPDETVWALYFSYTPQIPGDTIRLQYIPQKIQIAESQVTDLDVDLLNIHNKFEHYYTTTETRAITDPIKATADMARPLSEYKVMDNDTGLDLLQLPPGKYGKAQNLNTIQNKPTGLNGAFFCIVEYLNATSRRKITLYPFSENEVGKYYINVESGTPGTWGGWHLFTNGESFTNTSIPDGANIGYTDRSDPDNPVTVAGYTTPGMYYRGTNASSIIGRPSDYYSAFTLEVQYTVGNTRYRQILKPCALVSGVQQLQWYERYYTSTGWTDWIRHEGQAIAPVLPTPTP